MTDIELPDFDPKLARRAVRRGLVKTASIVLAALVVAALVLVVAPIMVQLRGDRDQRMTDVLGTAFKLYNPAYLVTVEDCCAATPWSLGFTVNATPIRAFGGYSIYSGATHTITQDFFGKVGRLPLGNSANTTLTRALSLVGREPATKEGPRKTLARLPQDLRALAVVEFVQPLTAEQLAAFGNRAKACPEKVVYERRPGSVPITWGVATWDRAPIDLPQSGGTCGDDAPYLLKEFRSWDAILRDYDAGNLRSFDLTLERVRKAAKDGLAYAYVDTTSTIAEFRKLLEDPKVKTVRVADVSFDLEGP